MADPVVDEVKLRTDIADLISQRVRLNKAGRYLKGLCPFHKEKSPSFVVYPDQGSYHCFGCSKTGDAFTWLRETEGMEFGDALRFLADKAGVNLPERTQPGQTPEVVAQQKAAGDALQAAAAWLHRQLLHEPGGGRARDYLKGRGLHLETIERFTLGWAPDRWDGLLGHLRGQGFTAGQMEEAGLALTGESGAHDRFRNRVMFPIRNPAGTVTGFGGRILGEGQPKYLNSPQTPFFDKSATLYALDQARAAIRQEGVAVVVEGYMDAVMPHQAGFRNVVASLGTALTEQQITLVKRYAPVIVLALDADAAGQAATLRGLEVARQALVTRGRPAPGAARGGYLQVTSGQLKIATLQGGKDPDEIVRENPDAWRALIAAAVPMVDHKIAVELGRVQRDDPRSKQMAVQELARFLALVPDRVEWGHYIDVIAQRLHLDVRDVRAAVMQAEQASRAAERARQPSGELSAGPAAPPRPSRQPSDGPPDDDGPPPDDYDALPGSRETTPARAPVLAAAPRDITEEYLLSLLVMTPRLVERMPSQLTPDDLRTPEYRELYRHLLGQRSGDQVTPGVPAPGPRRNEEQGIWGIPTEPAVSGPPAGLRTVSVGSAGLAGPAGARQEPGLPSPPLDATLAASLDDLVKRSRRRPPQTDSQAEADLVDVARRLRERNLRDRLREAQYLIAETASDDERLTLSRQVERLAAQLGRVQLERSRASLYTSPLN